MDFPGDKAVCEYASILKGGKVTMRVSARLLVTAAFMLSGTMSFIGLPNFGEGDDIVQLLYQKSAV